MRKEKIELEVDVVLGKAMEIKKGKTYIIRATGADLTSDQARLVIKQLNEQTGAKWIYMSGSLEVLREA